MQLGGEEARAVMSGSRKGLIKEVTLSRDVKKGR